MANLFYKLISKIFKRNKSASLILSTPKFNNYIKQNNEKFVLLTKDSDGSADKKKLEAFQRFNEFLWRLDQRFQRMKGIEVFIYNWEPQTASVSMKNIQLEFVNRVESYYQQLYACLSAFAMFLNHVAPHSFRKGLPISSIKNMLEYLKELKKINISNELEELEKARIFRAKFVDHIQQHSLHNWMTFSYLSKKGPECVVIYYIGKGSGIYYRPHSNPYTDDFKPPVNCESFYVSPSHNECHDAMFNMCSKLIKYISAK